MPAAIAQLVEHDLAKVGVASSSLVCRSFAEKDFKRIILMESFFSLVVLAWPLKYICFGSGSISALTLGKHSIAF